jgi:hypothetical protein
MAARLKDIANDLDLSANREKMHSSLSGLPRGIILALAGMAFSLAHAQGPSTAGVSQTTVDRLEEPGWWPTKGDPPRSQYSGTLACAGCHQRIAQLQESTPMYRAGVPAVQSDILRNNESLRFQEGSFTTSLTTLQDRSTFSVTDGVNTTSLPAVWAFGFKNGQTYVLEKDGAYFESRLSYFTKSHSLDITPGHSPDAPKDLEAALGRKMDVDSKSLLQVSHNRSRRFEGVRIGESYPGSDLRSVPRYGSRPRCIHGYERP